MIEQINSPYIHVATTENFTALVLENSSIGPVLVHFMSLDDADCLRQHPVLESVIQHYDGRVLLVIINTVAETPVTSDYKISSVPVIKIFRNGEVVESLAGLQNKETLIHILDNYVARDSDMLLADAIQLYSEGKNKQAFEKIAEGITADADNPRLPLAMCKLLKHEKRYAEAFKLISNLPPNVSNNEEIRRYRDELAFYADLDDSKNLEQLEQAVRMKPDDCTSLRQLTIHAVLHQKYDTAMQFLSQIIEINPAYADNYAQQAMLRIFNIVGAESELVSRYRSNLMKYAH